MAQLTRNDAFTVLPAARLNAYADEIERIATGVFGTLTNTAAPLFRVSRTSDMSITSASYTVVPWQTADEDPDGMWDPGTPEIVTIRTPGIWTLQGQLRYSANDFNHRFNEPTLNATTSGQTSAGFTRGMQEGRLGDGNAVPVAFTGRFAEGDLIRNYAYQDSGSTLTLEWEFTGGSFLTGFWIGP